jgi:hypothetical protein
MNDDELTVKQGARLPLTVERGDPSAVSATLILKAHGTGIVKTVGPSDYNVDGVADVSLGETETSTVAVFDAQINENFTDEAPDKYPNEDCGDECSFLTITVCESLDGEDGP